MYFKSLDYPIIVIDDDYESPRIGGILIRALVDELRKNDQRVLCGLTLADAPDLERYDARFDDRSGHGGVEIWLPLTDMLHLKETDPCE